MADEENPIVNDPSIEAEAVAPNPLIAENDDEITRRAIEGALKAEKNGADSDDDFPDPAEADDDEEEAPVKPQRPESIPEKFWNAEKGELDTEALLKSYGELEKKQSSAAPEEPATTTTEEAPQDKAKEGESGGDNTVSELLARDDFNKEFGETGDLSDATRAKAAKVLEKLAGSSEAARELVDGYVEGLQLRSANVINEIKGLVPEGYDKLRDWAKENLTDTEKAQFDKEVKSGVREAKLAVRELYARFKADAEIIPTDAIGGKRGGGSGGGSVYATQEELNKDIEDPRYRTDEDFRAMVDAKIERSTG